MDYRVIGEAEMPEVLARIEGRKTDRFTALAGLSAGNREMSRLLSRINEQSPETARYLQYLDHKLNQLAGMSMAREMEVTRQSVSRVNLSAGGLAFDTGAPLAVGELLELRLVLLPASLGILTMARVVDSQRRSADCAGCGTHVAVEYVGMRESDRDLMVRHILSRERNQGQSNL